MAITVKHSKVSAIPDGADASVVRPSDWNADHSLEGSVAADEVSNTPAGNIAATTVQAAINELDTEKAPLASPTLTGTPLAPTAAAGTNTTQIATTEFVAVATQQIVPISASVAASALTVTLNPTTIDFRSATIGSGVVNRRAVASAISLVVTSGATLGTVNAQQSRIVVLAIDNAGTVELAVVNIAGGNNLDETGVISTTVMSSASDSANVIYSTTARTNVPYRVVGYVESTQATAGTWATAPSTIQGAGGNALNAMSSLGYGQTWQNVSGSRAAGTTYYNTTGKPIYVSVVGTTTATGTYGLNMIVNGVTVQSSALNGLATTGYISNANAIVPSGSSYQVTNVFATQTLTWYELR